MMKIEYCYYTLNSKINPQKPPRRGALLRVVFNDGLIGYADCHPWPELGDHSVIEQLRGLQQRDVTPLMRCSLVFARLDAEARHEKKSLMAGLKVPLSHYLIMDLLSMDSSHIDQIIAQGFTHVKIKLGEHLPQEAAHLLKLFLDSPLKIRLDLNEKLSHNEYRSFLKTIRKLEKSIDYVEDPFPFDPLVWKQFMQESPIPLACDRKALTANFSPDSVSFLILKSALHSIDLFNKFPKDKIIITSYLDHPLGQLAAAYTAAQIDSNQQKIHGLLSHYVYQPTNFSQGLSQQGPQFVAPSGIGFGYEELLHDCKWVALE